VKFDSSTGLSIKEMEIIKYNIKNKISQKLPELPDHVETRLFFQGRDAWMFSWKLMNKDIPINSNEAIALEVTIKLKKEFHEYVTDTKFRYLCNVEMQEDLYHPKLSMRKIP